MVEIKNNNKYEIGDWVWWFDPWDNLKKGIIYGIIEVTYGEDTDNPTQVKHAKIYEDGHIGSSTGARLSICWPSKEACIEAEKERSKAQVEEYKAGIEDVKDLVKFLFDYDVRSEYRDLDAVKAATEKAVEFGINLD